MPKRETVRSSTIITCPLNELVAELHDPHAGDPAAPRYGRPSSARKTVDRPETLKSLLVPYPADDMEMWPVNRRVGNVKNNDPSLSEPIALA
jgi:putative SOS response-associated peptidase YedK